MVQIFKNHDAGWLAGWLAAWKEHRSLLEVTLEWAGWLTEGTCTRNSEAGEQNVSEIERKQLQA